MGIEFKGAAGEAGRTLRKGAARLVEGAKTTAEGVVQSAKELVARDGAKVAKPKTGRVPANEAKMPHETWDGWAVQRDRLFANLGKYDFNKFQFSGVKTKTQDGAQIAVFTNERLGRSQGVSQMDLMFQSGKDGRVFLQRIDPDWDVTIGPRRYLKAGEKDKLVAYLQEQAGKMSGVADDMARVIRRMISDIQR